jgi:hypothetical protein
VEAGNGKLLASSGSLTSATATPLPPVTLFVAVALCGGCFAVVALTCFALVATVVWATRRGAAGGVLVLAFVAATVVEWALPISTTAAIPTIAATAKAAMSRPRETGNPFGALPPSALSDPMLTSQHASAVCPCTTPVSASLDTLVGCPPRTPPWTCARLRCP